MVHAGRLFCSMRKQAVRKSVQPVWVLYTDYATRPERSIPSVKYFCKKTYMIRQQTASLQPDDLFPNADLDGGVIEQEQIQLGVQILDHHGNGLVVGKERTAHIVVVPVPYHGEQEHGQEGGTGVGHHDLGKGPERTAAVQVCRILQLLGQTPEELPEDQNHQTGTDAVGSQSGQIHGPGGIRQRQGIPGDELDETENVKVPELHILGDQNNLGGHQDHHDDDAEQKILALEFKPGKAVSGEGTGHHLHQGAADIQQQGVEQSGAKVHNLQYILDGLKG